MYPLGHAQEGDPADGTYVHDSYRPAIGSEDLKTSGRYSPSCLSSQASLPIKNSGDVQQKEDLQMAILSPRSLPQCERHMKQVQLLFCEDDREPICLICSLSQEHRGHRVRPIEEAALEYKVGLFWVGGKLFKVASSYFIFPTTLGCWCIRQHSWAVTGKNIIQTRPAKTKFIGSCS